MIINLKMNPMGVDWISLILLMGFSCGKRARNRDFEELDRSFAAFSSDDSDFLLSGEGEEDEDQLSKNDLSEMVCTELTAESCQGLINFKQNHHYLHLEW